MNDPWMEWESDPNVLALLDHYTGQGAGVFSRRDTEGWLESSQEKPHQTEPDPSSWEITSHAAMLALGWLEIASTESSPRGKPSGYKVTPAALLKRIPNPDQESVGERVNG